MRSERGVSRLHSPRFPPSPLMEDEVGTYLVMYSSPTTNDFFFFFCSLVAGDHSDDRQVGCRLHRSERLGELGRGGGGDQPIA